jgi:hypothetical protein
MSSTCQLSSIHQLFDVLCAGQVSIFLLDSATLQLVPIGEKGEIFVASPGLASHYLGDPEKTAAKFATRTIAGRTVRVYQTGDAGRMRPGGELECLGRCDSTVKIRGYKVSVPSVELALMELAAVAAAAVAPLMDPSSATNAVKSLAVYVVGQHGMMSEAELLQLLEAVKPKLPQYAVPTHWRALEILPTKHGESRKLDRDALPEIDLVGDALPRPRAKQGGPLEETNRLEELIAGCWAELLGKPRAALSVTDNFFEVGGHSLLAARLVGELTSKYGLGVTVLDVRPPPTPRLQTPNPYDSEVRCDSHQVYDSPTIAGLAARHAPKPAAPVSAAAHRLRRPRSAPGGALAVVGMAGRF